MSQILVVCKWDAYQHYKGDRNNTWVKLYADMITSESWVLGTDLSRLVQVASLLLASRYQNATPLNLKLLKKVLCLDCSEESLAETIAYLIDQKFFELQGDADAGYQDASAVLATCLPRREEKRIEEKRIEEKRVDKLPMSNSKIEFLTVDVQTVFEHWKQMHNHGRAKLDTKRAKIIKAALKSYSVADLCMSITGYLSSPHHMGQNASQTVYDDIGLFLRDAAHIDAGIAFFDQPPTTQTQLTQTNISKIADWMPEEIRNADK